MNDFEFPAYIFEIIFTSKSEIRVGWLELPIRVVSVLKYCGWLIIPMDGVNHPSVIEIWHFAFNAIFDLVYKQSVKQLSTKYIIHVATCSILVFYLYT